VTADLLGPAASAGGEAGKTVYSVSQLNARVKGLLEEEFSEVLVEGELSSWRTYPSGHAYFDIKDQSAKISAVMFSGRRRLLRFEPEVGMRVLLRCRVTLYERDGRYQLSVLSMDPMGEGVLEVAFRQLMERLEKEGLFDAGRKRLLPERPRRVALVTSREGAVVRDMLRVLGERSPIVEVVLIHTLVQGHGAGASIVAALGRADQGLRNLGRPADLIVVGRGGGSREDLWAFNEEAVVRAIVASETPVLSAVGHEVDTSLSDLAADASAATPTAAAEAATRGWQALSRDLNRVPAALERLVAKKLAELEARLEDLAGERVFQHPEEALGILAQRVDTLFERIGREARHRERARASRLSGLGPRLVAASPGVMVRRGEEALAGVVHRLGRAVEKGRELKAAAIGAVIGRLEAVSPLGVLARGYSLAYKEKDGALLRRAEEATVGDRVRLRLSEGMLACRVEEIFKEGEGS
jgi:exodeoxyribonuclease VII large subunit